MAGQHASSKGGVMAAEDPAGVQVGWKHGLSARVALKGQEAIEN